MYMHIFPLAPDKANYVALPNGRPEFHLAEKNIVRFKVSYIACLIISTCLLNNYQHKQDTL